MAPLLMDHPLFFFLALPNIYTVLINNGIRTLSKYTTAETLATLNAGNEFVKFFTVEIYRIVSDSIAHAIFLFLGDPRLTTVAISI